MLDVKFLMTSFYRIDWIAIDICQFCINEIMSCRHDCGLHFLSNFQVGLPRTPHVHALLETGQERVCFIFPGISTSRAKGACKITANPPFIDRNNQMHSVLCLGSVSILSLNWCVIVIVFVKSWAVMLTHFRDYWTAFIPRVLCKVKLLANHIIPELSSD